MATVYISNTHSGISEALVKNHQVFSTNMDLMVFAAMLGASADRKYERYTVESQGNEINESTFERNHKDGSVYLSALLAEKDGDILREEHNNKCWKIFEQFAEHGFQIINEWSIENPSADKVDLILNKMKLEAIKNLPEESNLDTSGISFT